MKRALALCAAIVLGFASHGARAQVAAYTVNGCGTTAQQNVGIGGSLTVDYNTSNLCVNTAGGGGSTAVTIADGADVTLGAKADAKSTATDTTPITAMQVLKQISASVQAPPSQAVTNAGTFAVQNTQGDASQANAVSGTTAAMTGTTSTSLIASPGGSLHNYILNITCVNSHATVGTFVTVQDGSGGTALYTLAAASVFGGSSISFAYPGLRQPTAATALYVADVTTGANVICSASGYKGS